MIFDLNKFDWNSVTAIATIIAVIVALFLGFKRQKPKIQLLPEFILPYTKIVAINTGNASTVIYRLLIKKYNSEEEISVLINENMQIFPGQRLELNYANLQDPTLFRNVERIYCIDTSGKTWSVSYKNILLIEHSVKNEPETSIKTKKVKNLTKRLFRFIYQNANKDKDRSGFAFLGMLLSGGVTFSLTALFATLFVQAIADINIHFGNYPIWFWIVFIPIAFGIGFIWIAMYLFFKYCEKYIIDKMFNK